MFTRGTAQACITVARKSLGLSQRELAKKAGVSQSRMQRIECDLAQLKQDKVQGLSPE